MTTVQIVGIAVASAIVLVLVIALFLTRGRTGREKVDTPGMRPRSEAVGSFLDQPVSDTLSKLGKAERETERAPEPPDPQIAPAGSSLGLDWGPAGNEPDEMEITGELPAVELNGTETPGDIRIADSASSPARESGTLKPSPPARPGEAGSIESGGHKVPLSDIIVTTSGKLVDLDDPEVRRMLTDLVTFEIDQATAYRLQGQSIDAVLQLTEAEKICKALGLEETAQRIRQMMADLNV